MSHALSRLQTSRAALAALAGMTGCGGGSGDVTGPPGGGPGTVDSLVLSLDSADVIVGDTLRITAVARDAGGQIVSGVRLSYSSSDPAVATVSDDGLVTTLDIGMADIAVAIAPEAGSRAASAAPAAALVAAAARSNFRLISVPRVVITPGEQTLDPTATSQYSARLTNTRGADVSGRRRWRWRSTEPSVASITPAGLATALKEGDTWITVSVQVGELFRDVKRVPLHVLLCGGVFRVARWEAVGDPLYEANGAVPAVQATYFVHQRSTGTATLRPVAGLENADSAVWEGAVAGDVEIDTEVRFPVPPPINIAVTTEKRSGTIEPGATARARLVVRKAAEGSRGCTYDFQYGDWFTWTLENNQGAPPVPHTGPVGVARVMNRPLPPPRSDGRLLLGDLNVGVALPARAFQDTTNSSDYTVGTIIGAEMIILLDGGSGSYREATFTYFIQGMPQ